MLTEHRFKHKLSERIRSTDWNRAKQDLKNLLRDQSSLELWSDEFFNVICERIKVM